MLSNRRMQTIVLYRRITRQHDGNSQRIGRQSVAICAECSAPELGPKPTPTADIRGARAECGIETPGFNRPCWELQPSLPSRFGGCGVIRPVKELAALIFGDAAPHAEALSKSDRVLPAEKSYGAFQADKAGGVFALTSFCATFAVWMKEQHWVLAPAARL